LKLSVKFSSHVINFFIIYSDDDDNDEDDDDEIVNMRMKI